MFGDTASTVTIRLHRALGGSTCPVFLEQVACINQDGGSISILFSCFAPEVQVRVQHSDHSMHCGKKSPLLQLRF